MTEIRSEVLIDGVEGIYHCISKCVRHAFLCGTDPNSGKSFEHRKEWVKRRLEKLAGIFSIEVLAYAVMSNHVHLVLRTRPDWVEAWDDEETARRWLHLFYNRQKNKGKFTKAVRQLAGQRRRLAVLRQRLGSISWLMRCLNENIARRANIEDGCKGRFWNGRFYCQALLDESAVLACMAYVDLNPIRAGIAATPEDSRFTSIFERINMRGRGQSGWLCPIGDEDEPDRRGALSLTLDDYLTIVDWTGRQIRSDKRGAIPADLAPLLDRLDIRSDRWLDTVRNYGGLFQRVAGKTASIRQAASRIGQRWLTGLTAGRKAFSD